MDELPDGNMVLADGLMINKLFVADVDAVKDEDLESNLQDKGKTFRIWHWLDIDPNLDVQFVYPIMIFVPIVFLSKTCLWSLYYNL